MTAMSSKTRYEAPREPKPVNQTSPESRKMPCLVGVRMTQAELAELDFLREKYGKSRGEFIRLAVSAIGLMEARGA